MQSFVHVYISSLFQSIFFSPFVILSHLLQLSDTVYVCVFKRSQLLMHFRVRLRQFFLSVLSSALNLIMCVGLVTVYCTTESYRCVIRTRNHTIETLIFFTVTVDGTDTTVNNCINTAVYGRIYGCMVSHD